MAKLLREMTPSLAQNAYRHLSHFVAINQEKQLSEHLWEFILLQAMAHIPGARIGEIVGKVAEVFGLELEEYEVKSILSRLVRERKVRELKGRSSRFYLNAEASEQIREEWRQSRELENRVLDRWVNELSDRYDLSAEDVRQLKSDIREFLTCMLRQYGAECAKLAGTGAPEEVQRIVTSAADHSLASLPTVSEALNRVRRSELTRFFLADDEERHEYLRQLTQAMYVLFAVEIDPELSTLLVSNYAGGFVLLDTNLAFSLLGLDGPDLEKAMATLIKYSRALHYEPVISLKTRDELAETVRNRLSELLQAQQDPSPAYMQQVLDDPTYADDVFKTYYRQFLSEYRRTGSKLSREAFSLQFTHPEERLEEKYSVKLLTEQHEWVVAQTQILSDQTHVVMEASAHRPDGPKSQQTAEHDAFNRLLAQRLRGSVQPTRFVDSAAWFVSNDRTLIVADAKSLRRHELPVVILADAWMQMARLSLPRSINGDGGFATLIAAPYLRNVQIPTRVADIIGGYLALESSAAPELQVRMLQDKMLTDRLQRATNEEIQIELDQAAARIAAEEAERRQQAERQLEEQTRVAQLKANQVSNLSEQVRAEGRAKEILQQENLTLQERVAALEFQEEQRRQLNVENTKKEQEQRAIRIRRRRQLGRTTMVVLVLALAATTPIWRPWPALNRTLLAGALCILLALSVLLADSWLGFKTLIKRWSAWVGVNLFIVALGYVIANLVSKQSLSDIIMGLSVAASIASNPISGWYLPSPHEPKAHTHDTAA